MTRFGHFCSFSLLVSSVNVIKLREAAASNDHNNSSKNTSSPPVKPGHNAAARTGNRTFKAGIEKEGKSETESVSDSRLWTKNGCDAQIQTNDLAGTSPCHATAGPLHLAAEEASIDRGKRR